jgi:methylase of polypeptide subunit release factors
MNSSPDNLPIIPYDASHHLDYQSLQAQVILQLYFAQNTLELLLETNPQVWSPTAFTTGMAELIAADHCQDKVILDVAMGSGILGIVAGKRRAKSVIMTDFNPEAIIMAQRNWKLNGLNPDALTLFHSNCFDAIANNRQLKESVDLIYANPPTLPDIPLDSSKKLENLENRLAVDWNRNGDRGRLVTDALIKEAGQFLKPGGEMLFVTTSKQGSMTTWRLMEEYWGQTIKNPGEDPLDYEIDWQEREDLDWAVVKRLDVPLASYYWDFLPLYRQLAEEEGEPNPIIERDGKLYQKLYFIRAKKPLYVIN